ncbi:MAG: hypothetical protein WC725_04125 [Patescibacteria group bacterium]|jgi:hypothetical protein
MTEEQKVCDPNKKCCKKSGNNNVSGGAYGLGFIGAAIYLIQHATTFWGGVLGFLKALVWPAFLVYKVMEFFKM